MCLLKFTITEDGTMKIVNGGDKVHKSAVEKKLER